MSNTRPVQEVTVTYADGETETFKSLDGFYRTKRNNKSHDTTLDGVWLEHEIRWSDKQ